MRPSARAMAVEVAGDAPVDEDDWEWTIALARARVAVEETESARPPEPVTPHFAPPVIRVPPMTTPAAPRAARPTPPPPVARPPTQPPVIHVPPMAPRAARPTPSPPVARPPTPPVTRPPTPSPARPTPRTQPAQHADWIRAAAAGFASEDDRATRPAAEPATRPAEPARTTAILPTVAVPRTTTPSTVIPVPPLPTVDASVRSRMEPVIRTVHLPASQGPASALNRFAKGTAPLDPPNPPREAAVLVEDTIPNLSVGDRTTPGIAPVRRSGATSDSASTEVTAQSAPIGDRTRPGIALPRAARAVELPSIKRRSAPR